MELKQKYRYVLFFLSSIDFNLGSLNETEIFSGNDCSAPGDFHPSFVTWSVISVKATSGLRIERPVVKFSEIISNFCVICSGVMIYPWAVGRCCQYDSLRIAHGDRYCKCSVILPIIVVDWVIRKFWSAFERHKTKLACLVVKKYQILFVYQVLK